MRGMTLKILLILLALILSGCTTYDIKRCVGEGGEMVCSEAHINSARKFKHVALRYDGVSRTFILEASDVSTDTSALNTLASVILMQQQAAQGVQP